MVKYDSEVQGLINKDYELENEIVTTQDYQDKIIVCKCLITEKIKKNSSCNKKVNFEGFHALRLMLNSQN